MRCTRPLGTGVYRTRPQCCESLHISLVANCGRSGRRGSHDACHTPHPRARRARRRPTRAREPMPPRPAHFWSGTQRRPAPARRRGGAAVRINNPQLWQIQAPRQKQAGLSLPRCRLTATWQFAVFPSAPPYSRTTLLETSPCFVKKVLARSVGLGSVTGDTTSSSHRGARHTGTAREGQCFGEQPPATMPAPRMPTQRRRAPLRSTAPPLCH